MKLYKALLLFSFLFIQLGIFAQTTITIGISNGGSSICAGANITFYSQITNCAAPTYQWFINSIPVSGATNFTFTTNTLQNGDIVSARQTNATAPCTIANSNTIAITVTTQPVLTLSSGVGSNNQTVCQNVPLNNITYNVTGSVGSFSSSGFPTGISAILNNGVVTISGSTSQTGTFNYTVTASTTFCGNASATGTIIVSKRITPVLIPFLGSSTQLSIFNGIEYLIRCTSTPPSSINIANDIPAGDQLLVTNYKIEWGDGTPDTTFNPFSTNIVHLYQAGFYQLIITTTSTSGCTASKTYGVFVGNSPSGSLANPGNLSGCVPKTIDFPISATAGNIPGTIYKIYFGDGDSATYIHPNVPAVVPHTYLITSCGKNLGGPNPNSFTATMTVTNPCYPISISLGFPPLLPKLFKVFHPIAAVISQ